MKKSYIFVWRLLTLLIVIFFVCCLLFISFIYILGELYKCNPKFDKVFSFSNEEILAVQKEFMFTLPEGAYIDNISAAHDDWRMVTCTIVGITSVEEFVENNIRFSIEKRNSEYDTNIISFSISGFSSDNDIYAALIFYKLEKKIIISKRGGVENESLFDNAVIVTKKIY